MIVCFDVDGTLIHQIDGKDVARDEIVALLKLLHKKGNQIIVWSGGGAPYAATQSRMIGIDNFVYRYASKQEANDIKPYLAIDDQVVNLGKYNIRV